MPKPMRPLQMVDLVAQYEPIAKEINTRIQNVMSTAAFINGPEVKELQQKMQEYVGVKHAIPCANGTDALQIALMALDLQPGDEVITASYTYIATVEVVQLLGLTPVFVDVDPDNFNILPSAIDAAITDKTKAIIPVHLYGQAAPMAEILEIAAKHDIPVIEDNAQAMGGDYIMDGKTVKTGSMATISCTSFFPSKNLGCYGDGGMMYTNDSQLAERLAMIANHGQKVRYYHDMVGCNSRLDSMQAAVLNVKLPLLDNYCDARRKAADFYDAAFAKVPELTIPKRETYAHHVFHQYTLQLTDEINRDELVAELAKNNVPAMIYYPVPCHKQKMFDGKDIRVHDMTNTDFLTPRVFSLPMHTELSDEQLEFITTAVKNAINLQKK